MIVHWTDTAQRHLAAIYSYIEQDSPEYALRMIDRLRVALSRLQMFLSPVAVCRSTIVITFVKLLSGLIVSFTRSKPIKSMLSLCFTRLEMCNPATVVKTETLGINSEKAADSL